MEMLAGFSSWGFLSFYGLSVFPTRSDWVMGLKVCIANGAIVALNVDDARRGIGTGAKFAIGTVL